MELGLGLVEDLVDSGEDGLGGDGGAGDGVDALGAAGLDDLGGSCSMALELMPWVSELSPTVTVATFPSLTSTVTGTLPPMPLPSAVYSPSVEAAATVSVAAALSAVSAA